MNVDTVMACLCLPAETEVDQRVPKKLLVENGAPTSADRRQINEGIEELLWLAALKPTTIGVPAYRDDIREYLEIAVLSITFRPKARASRIVELIHRAIPYPVFLIQTYSFGLMLSLAHVRWSQGQSGQTVIDGSLITTALDTTAPATADFLRSLDVSSQPRKNLHALYQGWIEKFEAYAAARVSGAYTLCESPGAYQTRREALSQHDLITREITALRARAAKEIQINRRVQLNLQLKQLESRLEEALRKL